MPKTTASGGPRADKPWRHHAVSTPLLTAATVYAAGDAIDIAHLPPGYALAGAGVGVLSSALAARFNGWRGSAQTFVTCCATAAGTWLSWSAAHPSFVFTRDGVASLAIGTLAALPLYPVVRKHRFVQAATAAWRREQERLYAEADIWVQRLAAQRLRGITVEKREQTGAGETLHLLLPEDGTVKFRQILAVVENLTIAADLHEGAIRAEKGATARRVLLHVADRDVLAELVMLPEEHSPLSINDPLPVGVFEDGQTATLLMREIATLIVGIRGSGKSNFINVLIAALTRCVDAVIWMIDLKGGRTAKPWLEPWLAGSTDRPVIDWVATDRAEAERMLRAGLRIIEGRAHSGDGGEKIVPSAHQPAIILICEEVALIFGAHSGPKWSNQGTTNNTLASLGMQITQLGRSEAFDPVLVTQRGTVSMTGSGDLKSQCNQRIGLGVATEADARLVFPDDVAAAADLSKLRHPGSFAVQVGRDGRAIPAKAWRMEFEDIGRTAEAHSWIRPGLDPRAVRYGGADYEQRWSFERAGYLTSGGRPTSKDSPAAPVSAGAAGPGPVRSVSDLPPSKLIGPPPRGARPAGHTIDGTPLRGAEADAFEAIAASWSDVADVGIPEVERTDPGVHPSRLRVRALLAEAGPAGITVQGLSDRLAAEQLAVARQTMHRWLDEDIAAGLARKVGFGRYSTAGTTPEQNPN